MPLSAFHPTVRRWFAERLGAPTAAQRRGWPAIRAGRHVLIAAPTGSGKTLAAFLAGLDALLRLPEPPDEARLLYVSPLRALSNDVQKNLRAPLAELRALDPSLPEVRVLVRTGDTTQAERGAMKRRPPHVLVTTPESLYVLLGSEGGRGLLAGVRTAVVDEIHAVVGDKRGAHLALSLERLEHLAGRPVQRVGLSATQKPLADIGRFLVGVGRECELVDEGHLRELDLAAWVPPSPLDTVCSHETFDEIFEQLAAEIRAHRTTLVFVSTRKMAERVAARLAEKVGGDAVTCHHSSLAKERRLDAEERLKAGRLRALVATASLELGIDVGDIDLVCQLGATRSIATFLQRVGRAGHGVGRLPKGRLFPLTREELAEASALLRCVRAGRLDRTPQPVAPLDVLAQQLVAECALEPHEEGALFARLARAHPYRALARADFDALVALHAKGRRALLHRDGVNRILRGTRRARLTALLSGGAIPDRADYPVVLQPEGTLLGSVDEDFAVESSGGDVFQLGNASWRVLRLERGRMLVADAHGAPPSLPFWFGEAPARTEELSEEVAHVRAAALDERWLREDSDLPEGGAAQLAEHVAEGARVLGCVPTRERLVLERFFDETGGTQLVLHAPLGGRVNRAFGLALRKRFCRRFGFELQAAANEDAVVLSLAPQHSFPLAEVFDYLRADTVRALLVQAVLPTPMFTARWRWNVCRALLVERMGTGGRVPAPLLRMRADDLLAEAFPDVVACGENLPPGDLPVPLEHPLVRQTVDDCLHEAMDVEGLERVLRALEAGAIERVCVDTPEPSAFARAILAARPYAFLDDAPLEERRTQAVQSRRVLDPKTADQLAELSPEAVARVRSEAWPDPRDAEEVHEALGWMGYVTDAESAPWAEWLAQLAAAGRVVREDGRWYAAETGRDPLALLRGRLEALGPVFDDDPLLRSLEQEGAAMRTRLDGRPAWCDRRLLARIHRYTMEGLRREIRPVAPATLLAFLARWQHVAADDRLEGPDGVRAVVHQLAGFELPARGWEKQVLAARVRDYRPEWLDQLGLTGEVAWGRLFGASKAAPRATPLALLPRADLARWLGLADPPDEEDLGWRAARVLAALRAHGASFAQDLVTATELLPGDADEGLAELVARGLVTSDSFAALRRLLAPPSRRKGARPTGGRWSLLRSRAAEPPPAEFVARALLDRYGVIFRALLARERQPLPWRDLARACRLLELRGEVRGGRFVEGFSGEQFALPTAVPLLRKVRRDGPAAPLDVAAADPLNLAGILTPDARVPSGSMRRVAIGG